MPDDVIAHSATLMQESAFSGPGPRLGGGYNPCEAAAVILTQAENGALSRVRPWRAASCGPARFRGSPRCSTGRPLAPDRQQPVPPARTPLLHRRASAL